MSNSTLTLLKRQITAVTADISMIELHIATIAGGKLGMEGHLSRKVQLLRGIQARYVKLREALEVAASSIEFIG